MSRRIRGFFARVRKYVNAKLEYFEVWIYYGDNTKPLLDYLRRESEIYQRERQERHERENARSQAEN